MTFLKKNMSKFIPSFLQNIIEPNTLKIEKFASSLGDALPDGKVVIDAGAGETPFKKYFQNQHYISIDTQWGDPDWNYSNLDVIGDLTILPLHDSSVDGALCTQVLEHVNDPQKVVDEIARVLKKDGVLHLTAPQGWGVHQEPHDYFRFTSFGLIHLLEKAGFFVDSVEPTCGYFGYLANRLTLFPKVLFWQIKSNLVRLFLLPFEIVSYFLFVLVFPLLLNFLDGLDRERRYTLNYLVKATKKK